MLLRFLAPALLAVGLLPFTAQAAGKADLILLHGHIETGAAGRTVQALAVQGGQIIAAGSDQEIQAMATAGTQVIDLAGRSATPGKIETDGHISADAAPAAILARIEALHRRGVTAVRDIGITEAQWDAYRAMLDVHNLPERVCVTWEVGNDIAAAKTAMDNMGSAPRAPASFGDGRLISCGPELAKDTDPAIVGMIRAAGFPERSAKGRSAASLLYLDGITGTLAKGKRADIAVWDREKCVMTLLEGEVVWRAEQAVPQVSKR